MTSPQSDFKRKIVLLVEDDYSVVKQLKRRFTQGGAIILGPASNVPEALALAQAAQRIDGAVLDINLQGELVFPVADVLADRGVRFVFATGHNSTEIPARHKNIRLCSKPVDFFGLAEALFG